MNIEMMQEYVEVVRFGNYSNAAKYLNISQPTLSKHIASLERELDCVLIERTSRSFQLTRQGRIFFEVATDVLNVFTKGKNRLRDSSCKAKVTVAGLVDSPAVSELVVEVRKSIASGLDIEAVSREKYPVDVCLANHYADIVFTPYPDDMVSIMEEFEFVPILKEPLIAVVSENDVCAQSDFLSINDLKSHVFIRLSDGFSAEPGWKVIESTCNGAGFSPLSRTHFLPSHNARVQPGEVLVLPESEIAGERNDLSTEHLHVLRLVENPTITLYLIASIVARSSATERFIKVVKELSAAREQSWLKPENQDVT